MLLLISRLMLVSSVGATGFFGTIMLNYGYQLMERFAFLLIIPIGFWVAGWTFLIVALERSQNPLLKRFGQIIGTMMMLTALYQGVLYSVLVAMAVGYALVGVEFPDNSVDFIHDALFGAGYLAALVFGASGLTVLFTRYHWPTRILALILGAVGVVVPLVVLLAGLLRPAVESNMVLTLIVTNGFALVISALLMLVMSTQDDPDLQRKAELKRRLKAQP